MDELAANTMINDFLPDLDYMMAFCFPKEPNNYPKDGFKHPSRGGNSTHSSKRHKAKLEKEKRKRMRKA